MAFLDKAGLEILWGHITEKIDSAVTGGEVSKATSDSAGQVITETYIKGLGVSGKVITYTRGDGSTGTITTQDTTYSAFTGASSSAAGKIGLVPAPAAGKQASFLRGDGTWVVPTNTTYSVATTSENGLMSSSMVTKLNGIETGAQVNTITGIKGNAETAYRTGNVNLTPTNIGAIALSVKGAASGVAELDETGKVPSTQLPSYVDDVIEGYYSSGKFYTTSDNTTEITSESGKIYVDLTSNKTYRWSGTTYTIISDTIALGETSTTAYRGDRGKIAYDHSQATHARTDATKVAKSTTNGNILINGTETVVYTLPTLTKASVGLGNVDNTADSSKSVKSATSATQDSSGQVINSTYIKMLSVSGKTITYTKGDNSTGTITTQDTTYSAFGAASSSAAGTSGLVPAPAAGKQSAYLRGDGTWNTPTNTTYSAITSAEIASICV